MTYTLSYLLFERSPVVMVILGAVLWHLLMSRALKVLLLPFFREWREIRSYERAAKRERAEVVELPRRRPSPRRAA